jgi:hypothetical protein
VNSDEFDKKVVIVGAGLAPGMASAISNLSLRLSFTASELKQAFNKIENSFIDVKFNLIDHSGLASLMEQCCEIKTSPFRNSKLPIPLQWLIATANKRPRSSGEIEEKPDMVPSNAKAQRDYGHIKAP